MSNMRVTGGPSPEKDPSSGVKPDRPAKKQVAW